MQMIFLSFMGTAKQEPPLNEQKSSASRIARYAECGSAESAKRMNRIEEALLRMFGAVL